MMAAPDPLDMLLGAAQPTVQLRVALDKSAGERPDAQTPGRAT